MTAAWIAVAALAFATPATAAPCDTGMSGIEYGLEVAGFAEQPGACDEGCRGECDGLASGGPYEDCYYDCMQNWCDYDDPSA